MLNALFKKRQNQIVICIDISIDSVAGSYVYCSEKNVPQILYTRKLPIENRSKESSEAGLFRALNVLCLALLTEGSPVVLRATGSGRIETILVAVGAPWQETRIRTEHILRSAPFVFTRNIVSTVLDRTRSVPENKILGNESIIGTSLNGYDTVKPYGKRALRGSVIILSSFIDACTRTGIIDILQKHFHSTKIEQISTCSLRYQAIRVAFPHERNVLLFDASQALVSIILIRNGHFIDLAKIHSVLSNKHNASWASGVANEITELAKKYPLPNTVLIIAPQSEYVIFEKIIREAHANNLWMSNLPPRVAQILPKHFTDLVSARSDTVPDISHILMALYAQQNLHLSDE